MTEGDILLTSEREGRYSNKKREKKQESKNKKMKYLHEESHQWVYIRTYKATRTKNAKLYNRISRSPGSRAQRLRLSIKGRSDRCELKKILSGAVVLFYLCGKKTETKNGTGR